MLKVDDVVVLKGNPFNASLSSDHEYIGHIGVVVRIEDAAWPIRVEHARVPGREYNNGTPPMVLFRYPETHLLRIGNLNDD